MQQWIIGIVSVVAVLLLAWGVSMAGADKVNNTLMWRYLCGAAFLRLACSGYCSFMHG